MLLLLLPLLWAPGSEATAQGAVKLDNYTFDKVIGIPGFSWLVKFDTAYAYGEKEDEFKALARMAYGLSDFLVGEVPVQEYGDKENDDLRERFKLEKEHYPAFFFFNKVSSPEPTKYTGAVKADDIAVWLRQFKIKLSLQGTIPEFDELAHQFLKEGLSDARLSEAKKLLATEQFSANAKAAIYVKIMEKLKEKGEAYVGTEAARVKKILGGKVTPEKIAELGDKLKILNVFTVKEEL